MSGHINGPAAVHGMDKQIFALCWENKELTVLGNGEDAVVFQFWTL